MADTTVVPTAATMLASRRQSRRFSAEGIHPTGQWNHQFVQAQFVGALINKRKRYESELRRVLSDNQSLRDKADYRPELVTATQASRALRRTRLFVTAIRQRGGVAQ
jgi:hypothetical protein